MQKDILNPIYYWNNLYNSNVIRHQLHDAMSKSFYENSMYQNQICKNIYFQLSSFKNNETINRRYKLPEGTLLYKVTSISHSQLCTKEVYINNINKIQNIEDICYNENFYTIPLFFIGEFLIMDIKVVFLPDGVLLGIEKPTYDQIIKQIGTNDTECRLELRQRSDMYKPIERARTNIFKDTYIEISENEYYDGRIHEDYDFVDVFISIPNTDLIYHSIGIYSTDHKGISVNIAFKRFILNNTNNNDSVRIWFFSMPNFTGYTLYETIISGENDKYFVNLKWFDHIITTENISIYEFNNDTFSIGKRLNAKIGHIFPDIYTISKADLLRGNLYLIVYTKDYAHSNKNNMHYNPISIYTNEYHFNYFGEVCSNTVPEVIRDYKPEPHIYDYNDFMTDEVFPDIRAYDFNKYISCMTEFPNLMNNYLEIIHKLVRFQFSLSSQSELIKVIVDRKNPDDEIFIEREEFSGISLPVKNPYIKFTNFDDEEHNIELFVNGLRILSYWEETVSHVYYVLLPISFKSEDLKEISLTVCKHPLRKKYESEIIFTEKGETLPFPDSDEFGDISLGDIIFVDKDTGEYIDPGDFGFSQDVDKDIIDNPYNEDEFTASGVTDIIHLLTQNTEYYATMNKENIILNKAKENIPCPPDFIPNESNKVIDSDKIHIECTDEKYINKEIIITNTTEGGRYGCIPDCSDNTHNHKIIFNRWTRDPSRNRFRAYHNGLLLKDSDYDYIPPEKYGGDAIFDFSKFTSGNILVDYIPYREYMIYDGDIINDWIHDKFLLIDISQFVDYGVCSQMIKIWIDGMFLSVDKIYNTKAFGYIVVDLREYEKITRITIYVDKIDTDCMENEFILNKDINRKLIDSCIDEEHTKIFIKRIIETAIKQSL